MSVLTLFFGWPLGGVWPNLVAAPLGAAPLFVWHHLRMRRHHERVVKREAAAQTEELKAHITTTLGGPVAPGQQGEQP